MEEEGERRKDSMKEGKRERNCIAVNYIFLGYFAFPDLNDIHVYKHVLVLPFP